MGVGSQRPAWWRFRRCVALPITSPPAATMKLGSSLSEDPSFMVAAGGDVIGNATHLRNLHQAGLWDPTPMVNDLRARRYGIVVLNAELYPEPVLAAIGRFYFIDRAVHINGATYHVFLPGSDCPARLPCRCMP